MKLVLIVAIMVVSAQADPCLPTEKRFGNSCYKLLTGEMTWDDASKICMDRGTVLMVPDSLDEHEFLWNMFKASSAVGDVWIGCNDKMKEGRYVREGEKGKECSYRNWAPGQPDNYLGSQHCLQMWREYSGRWDDDSCTKTKFAICERPFILPVTCLKEYTAGRFATRCSTDRLIGDLKTESVRAWALVCRDEARCRSFSLQQSTSRQAVCQVSGTPVADEDKLNVGHGSYCHSYYL